MSFDKNNRASRDRQPSPFRRASKFDHYDIPAKLPSPPQDDGPHPRHAIRPRSLADAYRDASRHAMITTYDEESHFVTSPSPRSKRQPINAFSPISQTSPPPKELEDAYRRIDEDDALADLVRDYDWEPQFTTRSGSRSRLPSSRAKDTNNGRASANGRPFSDAGFGDDLGDHRARKSRDYTKDEERLKRVTGQRSPVFSRAQAGRDALTADNLRRRMEDKTEADYRAPEADRNGVPSPNIPTGWGHRAGHRQEWERKPSQRSISEEEEEEKARRRWSPAITEEAQAPRAMRTSPRSPARSTLSARSALEERTANPYMQMTHEDFGETRSGSKLTSPPTSGGEPIPNSPITVFKNSSFARPSPSKRDSRDLLRKLSRTENPKIDQVQTPEPLKLFENKIYDKTPRVTGAWIDTPMTQRVGDKVELPEDLTKDLLPPRTTNESKDIAPPTKPTDVKSKAEEPKPAQTTEKELLPEPHPGKQSRPPLQRPHLPKSALETVIEDASSGKDLEFGDDTIESLQAFMDAPGEPKIEEDDEVYEKAVLAQLQNASSKGNDVVNLDSLNVKLNSLTRHIEEVKKGLDDLEGHVKQDTAIVSQVSSLKKKSPKASHLHTAESCKGCDTHSGGRVYAAIPLPRLWTRSPRSQRLRPTKLGWFIIISLSWYIIECLMWDQYSHPEISESCEGYCLQPDAPLYPWVTITMLWRWSHLSTIFTPIFAICVAFSRLVAQLMGLSDGYVDDTPELGNFIGEIRINGTPVAFPWLSTPTPEHIVTQTQQAHYTQQPVQPVQPVWSARNPPPQMWDNKQPSGEDVMDNDEYL
ncbi:hypothetical protein N7517_000700 [Penicillium concentricum]|uniref:Uncharacterized protein n=1 Tax=Penicillium concentricum TaxID=293559 RepID=A0A9W9SSM3_9EURO|nr:uncharacterized protein N7517_000700 [Penicillium concentricum]KAJ5382789.1 hypothetical protein N7517_000700 [Penicillium concentricum]